MPLPPDNGLSSTDLHHLLDRPDEQRLREYKYRFGQALVFGLPVLGLHEWGRSLGGPDADRWVGLLQALLTGWIVYVGAAGMLFEGVVRLGLAYSHRTRHRLGNIGDLIVSSVAIGVYLWSAAGVVRMTLAPAGAPWLRFHWAVLLLAGWTGLQAVRLKNRRRAARDGSPDSVE
jgi:hypothetical protein